MANVDDLIEKTFGYLPRSEPEDKPKVQKPDKDPPEQDLVGQAARAVQEALKDHRGGTKPVDHWKPVAAKVLGLQRLYAKRWQAVLDRGIQEGLFQIHEGKITLPVLATSDVVPEPTPPKAKPEVWNPPEYLPCGHLIWSSEGQHEQARQEGFCCHEGKLKRPISYQMLRGDFIRPVPKKSRRTTEKQQSMGWPGLCCHQETGLYIGGIANNCLYENPEGPWCEVHAKLRSDKKV